MGQGSGGEVAERLRAGSRCFVARLDAVVACYGWVTPAGEWIGEMDRRLALDVDEAYIWNCATLEHYRRRGLYRSLLGAMLQTLAGEGCRRVWLGSASSNEPSVRAFSRVGFRPVVVLDYWRLGAASFFIVTPAAGADPSTLADARAALRSPRERVVGRIGLGWRLAREATAPSGAGS